MFKFRKRHLYPREKYAKYSFGSVLLYRHDTWHRGTPLKPSCLRLVVNCTFRKAGSEWISTLHQGWAWGMYRRSMQVEKLIAKISVDQRCVLGFPGVGSSYWNHPSLDPSSEAAKKITDFGDGLAFPSTVDSVNELALHPQLLEAVSTLLRVPVQSIR